MNETMQFLIARLVENHLQKSRGLDQMVIMDEGLGPECSTWSETTERLLLKT